MDTINYIYNGKSWKASPTVSDKNSFFHAAFGKRVDGKGPYLDKLVKFRRSRWATFLSRFQNEAAMPPLVADMLQKCFSANEKYKHVSVEDQDHFQGYILDIMSAVYDVTMEEIHILATLENESVVLFKAGESEPVVIVDPDTEVFASYGCIEEPKGDVVLYLEGNVFSRMNPVLDSVIKYEKGGTAGIKGVEFQVSLLTVFFLNALQKLTDWQLFTEYTAAGKFDDVVMVWPDGATLLQAKYIQNKKKKITLEELLATNSRNDNFSIPKYFFSFKNIKKSFKIREVIICTTASVGRKAMKFLKAQQVDPDSLLHYDDRDYRFYTFNDNILPKLMENVKRYYDNLQNVDVDIKTITETNIQEFLRHLQLFPDYPAGKVIERLMSRIKNLENFYVDVSHKDIYDKMIDWFRQEKGECMTELYAKAIVSEINRDKHWQRLEKYKISFQRNDFLISNDSKRLFHFIVEGGSLLQEINILQTLHSNQTKFLFVNTRDGTDKYKQVEAFHLPKYTILVLVWPKITEEDTLHEVGCKLKKILDKFEYKKVVLIADRTNKIPQLSGLSQDNCKIINKPITLRDLSKDSQERILQKKKIIFQGSHVSLKEVLADQANEDYATFLNTEELEKLVRGEMINVGRPILELDEHIKQFYIKREFKKEKTKEIFPEELICEMREKVVLISDSAGMGKSTVLTNLAVTTKKKYPHLWVIRINLNDHTEILNEFLRKNRKSINILELLDSKDATKLTNQLERSLFSMKAKVVLMLDGFDEIGPDYTQLVLSLLSHSQEQQNFAKVIVTTRPHMARELREKLQVESFVLKPFVKQNRIDLLVNYWMHNLKPDNNQRAKCEKYAKAALARINKMSSGARLFEQEANHFAALPLHVRMIAEIFEENNQFEMSDEWESCKEYLVGDGIEPKLPEKMNVTRLYKMFIEKKRNVFVDKGNPSGNTAGNLALQNMFEECQEYHKNLAIKLILGKTKCKLFSCRRQPARNLEINVLKIGIVQKVDNIFQFAHRTYAEYFVAESLIEELQLPNENIEFQKFLIEEILLKYPIDIIHVFINSFLQEMIDKLSSNTLCKYQCVSYKITYFDAHKVQLINAIVKFGHLAIFQFILKCVDLNFFPKKLKGSMQFFQTPIGESIPEYSNVLNLVQQEAFVEPILISYTFLYHAAAGGHLEMVKFLVEQGANVNIVQFNPLQGAVRSGNFEVVKFLVEKGGYVDFADRWGTTALHIAVEDNNFRMAELLLNLGANVDFGDQDDTTALHTAVEKNNFQLAELLVNRGANVNLEDMKGNTALHLAAEKLLGNIIKFLVKRDANINSKNKADCTALYLSIGKYCTEENECPNVKKLDLIKFLIESGKDVNIKYADGSTVLHLAAKAGNLDIVNLLMEFGIDADIMDNNGQTALHVAALENHTHIVKFLMQHNADSNIRDIDGQTVLHSSTVLRNSIRNNDRCDVLKLIIEKAADINLKDNYGSTALYLASMRGDIDAVNLLVKHGADVNISNAMGATGLHLAALNGFSNVVECLVKRGADVNSRNSKGCTPLHLVAEVDAFDDVVLTNTETIDGRKGYLEVVELLLKLKADINIKDNNGLSVLQIAVYYRRLDIAKSLVKHGANINDLRAVMLLAAKRGELDIVVLCVEIGVEVNVTDGEGYTALQLALDGSHLKIVEYLVEMGADLTRCKNYEPSAMCLAAKSGDSDFMTSLLERCTGINVTDKHGNTALHLAVPEGLDIVKFLLDFGIDVNIKNNKGQTALHLASDKGCLDIAIFLVENGAELNISDNGGSTALHLAACCSLNLVKFLVERGADIHLEDNNGDTAGIVAKKMGHIAAFKYLQKKEYADEEEDGEEEEDDEEEEDGEEEDDEEEEDEDEEEDEEDDDEDDDDEEEEDDDEDEEDDDEEEDEGRYRHI